ATVFVSPGLQLTLVDFRPSSACTNVTACVPAATDTPNFGVPPSGRPSSTTFETGMELRLIVHFPAGAAAGVAAGAFVASACCGAGVASVEAGEAGVLALARACVALLAAPLPSLPWSVATAGACGAAGAAGAAAPAGATGSS